MAFRSFSVQGATIRGVEAIPVSVEVVISNGLPGFAIVGMADAAIQESRERVKAALRSNGFVMPNEKIVVNLAPGALRKTGSGFDLPIALGILAATGQMDAEVVRRALVVGELSLGGGVRCSAGMLAYQRCAAGLGLELIAGAPDEGFVKIEGLTCKFLERLSHVREPRFIDAPVLSFEGIRPFGDYSEVLGHEMAKRALQVAAAGGHGVIMVGPPGSGKTMLAQRFGGILPNLSEEERLETALIHSVVGEDVAAILAGRRPFRSPHHSATAAGLVGGGSPPHPGEASLAHNGVLFLDEMSEFKASVLQTLRQPLENGGITLTRADGTYSFPDVFSFWRQPIPAHAVISEILHVGASALLLRSRCIRTVSAALCSTVSIFESMCGVAIAVSCWDRKREKALLSCGRVLSERGLSERNEHASEEMAASQGKA